MIHKLKCWPMQYDELRSGRKKFDFRLNDRDYKKGDGLELHRYDPEAAVYSNEKDFPPLRMWITYIMYEGFGLPEGYCIMSVFPALDIDSIMK